MGRPKALLTAGDRTFIRRILDTLRDAGIADAVVVIRPGDEAIAEEIAAAAYGRAMVNPQPERGQLTSLLAGLDAVERPDVSAVLVTLVDVPLISPATVRTLCERAPRSSAQIVRAVYGGRHGHPVIFKRPLFDALRRADPSVGAKAVVRSATIEDVDTGDPAVVEDVDTPEDYRRVVSPAGGSAD
jgi:molybdenum cofactor cytidylyltransferase